ncbi:MAG TPA: rhomboid family intramembrane serine protease [Gemmatimonadales bacterium]|jgi:membrane associated rhomboid family serine protease
MSESAPRVTPWVGRLLAVNAVVLLLQQTVLTSDYLTQLLAFDPGLAPHRPWTFVTYMFLHGGLWHLAANSLALFVFGPTVERRLGSPTFIVYYLYCGIGAAIFALALEAVGVNVGSFIGASGAIIGVAYAFARMVPDAPLMVFPIPVPIRAKWVIALLAGYDTVGLFFLHDGIAHGAHLGGLASGIFYFVLRGIARPAGPMPLPSMRPRVPVAARGGGGAGQPAIAGHKVPVAPEPARDTQRGANETAEIDRVLDKISATGIDSLTAEERRFLDSVARRRRDLPH